MGMVGFRRSCNANCANSATLLALPLALPDVLGASTVEGRCQMLAVGGLLWFGQYQAGIRRKLRVRQPPSGQPHLCEEATVADGARHLEVLEQRLPLWHNQYEGKLYRWLQLRAV